MQKKLMATAVAGALAATVAVPAIAAESSSVQISGHVRYEYGIADNGQQRPKTDSADTPGSQIRFSGVENLGGGMAAWFQCESTADIKGFDQTGFCTRNSAVGLRGGFGNIFFGRWDTPFKRVMNHGTVGAEETGILGMSFLAFGGSGGATTIVNGENNVDVFGESMQRQRWKRRENCLTTYETPNFSGFQVMGAFTCADSPQVAVISANGTVITDGNSNKKPRVISFGGQYVNGPLAVGLGYELHKQFGSLAVGSPDLDDKGYGLGVSYGFMNGNVLVGFNWLRRKWETGVGLETRKDTWVLGVDWRLPGPHQIQVQYVKAGDSKGNGGSIGGNGGVAAPGSDTGADAWSIAYQYHASKRTKLKLGYVKVDNDSNVPANRGARIGNVPTLLGTSGQSTDGWAFIIRHDF